MQKMIKMTSVTEYTLDFRAFNKDIKNNFSRAKAYLLMEDVNNRGLSACWCRTLHLCPSLVFRLANQKQHAEKHPPDVSQLTRTQKVLLVYQSFSVIYRLLK